MRWGGDEAQGAVPVPGWYVSDNLNACTSILQYHKRSSFNILTNITMYLIKIQFQPQREQLVFRMYFY